MAFIDTFIPKTAIMAVALALVSLCVAPSLAQASESGSAKFVQKLGDTALSSLTKKDMDRAAREKRIREILRSNFDIQAIGQFSLGPSWRSASDAQRKEYMKLFEDMIVKTYTTRFEDYAGQTLTVGNSRKAGKDYLVDSQVIQKSGPPINLQWRVRPKGESYRIADVVVEGVSMSVTQRSDFASVIQGGGGDVEVLLASLRNRK